MSFFGKKVLFYAKDAFCQKLANNSLVNLPTALPWNWFVLLAYQFLLNLHQICQQIQNPDKIRNIYHETSIRYLELAGAAVARLIILSDTQLDTLRKISWKPQLKPSRTLGGVVRSQDFITDWLTYGRTWGKCRLAGLVKSAWHPTR